MGFNSGFIGLILQKNAEISTREGGGGILWFVGRNVGAVVKRAFQNVNPLNANLPEYKCLPGTYISFSGM